MPGECLSVQWPRDLVLCTLSAFGQLYSIRCGILTGAGMGNAKVYHDGVRRFTAALDAMAAEALLCCAQHDFGFGRSHAKCCAIQSSTRRGRLDALQDGEYALPVVAELWLGLRCVTGRGCASHALCRPVSTVPGLILPASHGTGFGLPRPCFW